MFSPTETLCEGKVIPQALSVQKLTSVVLERIDSLCSLTSKIISSKAEFMYPWYFPAGDVKAPDLFIPQQNDLQCSLSGIHVLCSTRSSSFIAQTLTQS